MIVALAANYMGTALMLGDLPPLLLHSVGGAEFFDFIVFRGRPSSFFVLLTSFILSIMLFYRLWFRRRVSDAATGSVSIEGGKPDKFLAITSIAALASLMILAAFRPLIGLPLGVLAIIVGMVTALAVEIYKHRFNNDAPSFDEVLKDVEWETMALYALLFSLTGALEKAGFFEDVAKSAAGLLLQNPVTAYTLLYWLTTALCMFVEHDAFLLIMLYMVKDMALLYGLDPWPYYWGLAWSATLGSNATISAAPTLYLALVLAEKRSGRKRHWKEWLRITLPFTLVSSAINFAISIPVLFL
jgi:Na+/H+ antiporter NhaD/arsenite permease-like protein